MYCQHNRLHFGSGDYYLMCADCDGLWARMSGRQPEYGKDAKGRNIGAHPGSANQGFVADVQFRVPEPR